MSPQIVTVSQFIAILNETLNFAFPDVIVEGEVASFKVNQGKWVFFDLKEEGSTLGCFMALRQLKVPLEDGMRVRVTGSPKLTNWGKFSFTVRTVELAGEGELKRAFELLKAKLSQEGLFDPERKRPLPRFPRRIGLVTSGQSAAYSDFMKIINGRWQNLDILLADIQVQGAAAPDQVVGAIEYFSQLAKPVDVVVIIRGGGSLEDLQAFSTESVARAVAASRTPTLVGVGHEVDVSLADYAADVRAATPTDAARLVVPDTAVIRREIVHLSNTFAAGLERTQHEQFKRLQHSLGGLESFVRVPRELVATREAQLRRGLDRLGASARQHALLVRARQDLISRAMTTRLGSNLALLESTERLVKGFDPTATLARGYAIVRHGDTILKRRDQVKIGDRLVIQLQKDSITSEVTSS